MAENKDGRIKRSLRYVRTGAAKMTEIARSHSTWSGLDRLPKGQASNIITPGCAVLEGGSFRGMYTSGVLDVFMENDINLQAVVGTSAGALNGLNYTAGEIGRSARINLTYRHDSRYLGVPAVAHGQSMLGLRFIVEDVCREIPLDFDRLNEEARRFAVTATDCRTGRVRYFEKGKCVEFLKAVRASASLPYVSKMVWVEGVPCLDGGLAVKVPYEWALEGGYQKIVVIRTREWGYRREPETERSRENALLFYREYREVANCLNSQCEQYNRQCDELERLHTEGRIYMLSPSQPINLGTMEGSLDKLAEVYYLGREDAVKHLDEIRGYLKSEVRTHE